MFTASSKKTLTELMFDMVCDYQAEKHNNKIENICFRNNSEGLPFYYGGKYYRWKDDERPNRMAVKLESEYVDEVKDFETEYLLWEIECVRIKAFIMRALNECICVADLMALMPNRVQELMREKLPQIIDEDETSAFTQEKIEHFQTINKDAIDTLNGRLMINMIQQGM